MIHKLMLVRGIRLSILIFSLGAWPGAGTPSARAANGNELAVFSAGKPAVYLDILPEDVRSWNLAPVIQDFQDIIGQMTGEVIPQAQTDPPSLVPIRLKRLPAPTGWEVFDSRLVQGYEIRVTPSEILLVSHTRLGVQNALYALLDRWGCRWVMIGKLGQVVPRHATLTLPVGTIKNPDWYLTSVQAKGGMSQEVAAWWDRNQGGCEQWMTGQHYWFYAIPPEKHFKDHPEWYSLIGGKRVPKQLCTSNPEVIAEMIKVARQFLKAHPTCLSFPMDPNDNADFCQCDNCTAQDPPGVGPCWGLPLMTDRVVRFANEVAKGIAKDYPDRVVAFYAYLNHTEPPVNVKPEKNVSVGITRSNHCLLHLAPHPECPSSQAYYELVRKWSKICSRIWTYEYDPISWTGCLPCPIYMERAASISLLAKQYGVMGGVTDYVPHFTKAYASTYINAYMERRAKANPDLTADQILSDLCRSFFGPAARPMEQYYRELATATRYTHPGRPRIGFGTFKYHELFNPTMIGNARSFLDQAIKASADQPPYDQRVRLVDLSQQYLEGYLEGIWSAQAGKYGKTVAAFNRVGQVIDKLDQANAIDVREANYRIMQTVRLTTLAEYFPDKMHYIRKWRLLGPFNNDRRDADLRVDSFEPIATIDRPVRLADGSVLAWTDCRSPEGKLKIIPALKGRRPSWGLSYIYAGVNLEAKTAQKVQFCMDSFYPFKVYLNGREVFYRPGCDAECPDKRVITVDLKRGKNTVVFKLTQTSQGNDKGESWGVYFRVKDMQGRVLKFQ